jgi:hypothetical protein
MIEQARFDFLATLSGSPLGWSADGDNEELQSEESDSESQAENNANALPQAAQETSWTAYAMLGIMGVQFSVQIAQWIKYGIFNRDPKSGNTPPPASNPYTQGLTPDQLQQAQTALNAWIGLGDTQMWTNLGIILADTDFGLSQQQQFYIVYLAHQSKTTTTAEKTAVVNFDITWPASAQLALASQLAGQDSIPDMCTALASYNYNGKVPPFGASAAVLLVAIHQKWPNL